jgi:AraC family transcriptional activator of pobA
LSVSKDFPLHHLPATQFLASDQSRAFGEHTPSHRIDFYAVVWFLEDGETHYIDFEALPVQKNVVYLLGKIQVHSIPAAELPEARMIVFSEDFYEQIEEPFLRQLFSPFRNKGISIPVNMIRLMTELFGLILQEQQQEADASMLNKYTTAFLIHIYRFGHHSDHYAEAEDFRMVRLCQLIETHYKEQRAASFYADIIGLTAKRINEILRYRSGTTVNGLINQLLLLEAKRELYHRRLSVKEIAYHLGFSDQSYFARFFRKHTGLTPEQFKAKQAAQNIL